VGDTWAQLDTVPRNGSTGKKKAVKYGADLVSYGYDAFFALKGNKTYEFWRYVIPLPVAGRPERSGVMAGELIVHRSSFIVSPNPLASGFATVRYSMAQAGPLSLTVYDVAGRAVCRRMLLGGRTGSVGLDLRRVAAGVYLVRFDTQEGAATRKLVVQR
jgi:hypothetical protein